MKGAAISVDIEGVVVTRTTGGACRLYALASVPFRVEQDCSNELVQYVNIQTFVSPQARRRGRGLFVEAACLVVRTPD